MQFERVVFSNLVFREEFGRKVIPFLKAEYFHDRVDKALFELIEGYVHKYNRFPSKETLLIDNSSKSGHDQDLFESVKEAIESLEYDPKTETDWLVDKTEKFCQEKAVYNGIMKSIQILDNKDQKLTKEAIPQVLSDALAVSFDTNIGHSFLDDAAARFEFYRKKESRIPFNLEYFNAITKGGLPKKTMTAILAGTGTGKSLFMCHCAAGNLLDGKNVLYITLEMSEERIAERIDANMMDITLEELETIPLESYMKKIAKIKNKTTGKLIIKEYPTSSAGSANFRHLLNELKLKKNFIPDIVYVDYINICASSRVKYTANVNSYTYIKAIAEELRGLAVEFDIPLVTATQTTRCLGLDTLVTLKSGQKIAIKNIKVGDEIESHSGFTEVRYVYPIETQEVYEITTKSGKKILCSDKHIFPTTNGEKNILSGLSVGDKLFTKK